MNKDKIIKNLKERNDKLANQYRLRDIRCVHLEMTNERLEQENKQLKEDFAVLKKLQMISNNTLNDLEEWLKSRVEKVPETMTEVYEDKVVLDKITELKEKYK